MVLSTSSRGDARRAATSSRMRAANHPNRRPASANPGEVHSWRAISWNVDAARTHSSSGQPSHSITTIDGTGTASSWARSASPRATMGSRWRSVHQRTLGRNASTAPGDSSGVRRSRWGFQAGGSSSSGCRAGIRASGMVSDEIAGSVRADEKVSQSR